MEMSARILGTLRVLVLLGLAGLTLPGQVQAQKLPDYEVIPFSEGRNKPWDAEAFVVDRKHGVLYFCVANGQSVSTPFPMGGMCSKTTQTNLVNQQVAIVPRRDKWAVPFGFWIIDQVAGDLRYCLTDRTLYCVNFKFPP
jgi:hypothetical protein